MAIGTDAAIEVFGTTDPVDDTTTSAITDGNMCADADIATWTNDDDAPFVKLILRFQYPSGTVDGSVDIHVRPINVDGTDAPPVPTTAASTGYAGSFEINTAVSATTDYPFVALVSLQSFSTKTSQEYEFRIKNVSGVTISANWDMDAIPASVEPNA